jgi:predicted DNA-binding transcriptional regulator YafY
MRRSDRLTQITQLLRDGTLHRAQDIATRCDVSLRTIYRDMDTLIQSGLPITGTRGTGYKIDNVIPLPPMTLTPEELEALNLGLAIVSESPDPDLKSAALSLADKLDAAQPQHAQPTQQDWHYASYPFASTARGFAHLAPIKSAIKARQKLTIIANGTQHRLRPLHLEYWGRIWLLTGWSDSTKHFETFRLDLIDSLTALPELFLDEPGKRYADHLQLK